VYYPTKAVTGAPDALGMKFQDLRLDTPDGEKLQAWYVSAAATNRTAYTLLFCHGNAGNIADRLGSIRTFHDLGLDVLIFDYRGYGNSTGRPTEEGTRLDADTAWRYLTRVRVTPASRIILFGRSLGGAVAARLAAEVTPQPAALVLESTFSSAPDMGARMFPYLPIRLLSRFRYDTVAAVRKVPCPVLVAHGRGDSQIPFALGQKVFAAANEPKRFIEIEGDHNDGGMDSDANYREAFREFLKDGRFGS
jgi:fermentation-respiration switch protein FrsA (DUF1100 family)